MNKAQKAKTLLKIGDMVMIIAGGSGERRELKGKTGKVLGFVNGGMGVLVEGLNMVKRHRRQMAANKPSGIEEMEAPVHISNVMYYVEKDEKPCKLRAERVDGKRVRGYYEVDTKKGERNFVAID